LALGQEADSAQNIADRTPFVLIEEPSIPDANKHARHILQPTGGYEDARLWTSHLSIP
jgi:hypothetical protein